jgi:hypothetical protein
MAEPRLVLGKLLGADGQLRAAREREQKREAERASRCGSGRVEEPTAGECRGPWRLLLHCGPPSSMLMRLSTVETL